MSRIFVFPWKMGSQSAKGLAQAIGVKRIHPDRNYKPRSGDVVINWGNSKKPQWWQALATKPGTTIINHPENVALATDKLKAFKAMAAAGVSIPEFTTDPAVAKGWLEGECPICIRRVLNGHSAEGLDILAEIDPGDEFPIAPLYTKYVKKKDEYRIHIFRGNVIDITKKRLRNGLTKTADFKIRNFDGGWIYARDGVVPPDGVINQAKAAVTALGLDFGAVDIGWNEHYQSAIVYEVNSAPGLVGTTLYRYARLISEIYGLPLLMEEPEHDFEALNDFDVTEFDISADEMVGVDPGIGQVEAMQNPFAAIIADF